MGYKGSSFPSMICLCCSTKPATLTSRVIRSLGQEFCKISPEVLYEVAMKKKPAGRKTAGPTAKKY
jgi:hypothetical protein